MSLRIDNLQFAKWSETVFRQMRQGRVDAVHATLSYHGGFREMVSELALWNRRFAEWPDLILPGRTGADVRRAQASSRTAIFFGAQNPSVIEDDLGLIEIAHQLGLRFLQLSYNNQSLLASGHAEHHDAGLTRFGREVVAEMNRVGMAVDLSHMGETSALQAIEISDRPVALSHANPAAWRAGKRNAADSVIRALVRRGGVMGLSLYPLHLDGGSDCTLDGFCRMVAGLVDRHGAAHFGIGSDLCQDQPPQVLDWMRRGRWQHPRVTSREAAEPFPPQPDWFRDNRDFDRLEEGLAATGLSDTEVAGIMGGNWQRFYDEAFVPSGGDGA